MAFAVAVTLIFASRDLIRSSTFPTGSAGVLSSRSSTACAGLFANSRILHNVSFVSLRRTPLICSSILSVVAPAGSELIIQRRIALRSLKAVQMPLNCEPHRCRNFASFWNSLIAESAFAISSRSFAIRVGGTLVEFCKGFILALCWREHQHEGIQTDRTHASGRRDVLTSLNLLPTLTKTALEVGQETHAMFLLSQPRPPMTARASFDELDIPQCQILSAPPQDVELRLALFVTMKNPALHSQIQML